MSGGPALGFHEDFPRNYEIKPLGSYSLVNPTEELHQFPTRLEEGDRIGAYVRVRPTGVPAWVGFFARGFESNDVANGIYSCPDPGALCVVVGGYAYVVETRTPQKWIQIEQRPVVQLKAVPSLDRLVFVGFTTITAIGESGRLWTTERLSWEGISIVDVEGGVLSGLGWDMMTDKEVPFAVDLITGISKGGARPAKG
jgi:hypothetical protein